MSQDRGSHKAPTTSSAMRAAVIDCSAYKKNDDGTWISIRNNDLPTPIGFVRINPGILFKPGIVQWELEVVKALEEASAQQAEQ